MIVDIRDELVDVVLEVSQIFKCALAITLIVDIRDELVEASPFSLSDAFVAKGVPLSFQFLKVRRPAFFSVPQGVLTPFFQSDQQCCEGRLFFQSDQQCCEGRRASSLISSVAKSVPPSLISSVAKGVPLTLISSVAKGVPLSFSFLKVFGPKHSIVFMCLDQNTR
ncbi:unnamed protein product [Rodentolepis nana]|uniref:Uncharacterized protein n=1 Tax=Rodentolepis nana TaxID=102285 RepID=A0A3P7T7K9_RODNA|nr:unnamed protein product [Rodentolepis nana]